MDVMDLKVEQAYEDSDRLWYEQNTRRLAALIGRFIRLAGEEQRCVGCQSDVFRVSDVIDRSYRMFCAICGVGQRTQDGKVLLSGHAGTFVSVTEALEEGARAEERMFRDQWMSRKPHWGQFSAQAVYGEHFCRPAKGRELVDRGLDVLRLLASVEPDATHYRRLDPADLELA